MTILKVLLLFVALLSLQAVVTTSFIIRTVVSPPRQSKHANGCCTCCSRFPPSKILFTKRSSSISSLSAVFSEDADTIFARLSQTTGKQMLDFHDLDNWEELQEIIKDDDLDLDELQHYYKESVRYNDSNKLDKSSFTTLYEIIDDLFVDNEDPLNKSEEEDPADIAATKEIGLLTLLEYLNTMTNNNDEFGNNYRIPCGLEYANDEKELVMKLVSDLEQQENLVKSKMGLLSFDDLVGEWKLLYTNSRSMSINKSLSGLGRSESKMAYFQGLTQKLGGSKYLGKAEFIEELGAVTATINKNYNYKDSNDVSNDSFNNVSGLTVVVAGEWLLKTNRHYQTGAPVTVLTVEPETVSYGPRVDSASDWSSLGPIKALDIVYLSNAVQISRGNVNPDTIFIWERIK